MALMQETALGFAAEHGGTETLTALDIGGRDVNGHARDAWPNAKWTVLDLWEGDGVDIVADAANWKPDQLYDLVLCTEVLEHTQHWRDIIGTAAAALGPGGHLVVTCAGPGWPEHSAVDGGELRDGEYYANVSAGELAFAMVDAGLLLVDVRQADRDTQAVARRRHEYERFA